MNHPPTDFKPCLYEHYKGGRYIALHLAWHHEIHEFFVAYVSLGHHLIRIREWATPGKDSWTDEVMSSIGPVPRFRYLGPAL